jgi:putative endonuclease
MANRRNGTLYTGVTSDLLKRNYQHKNGKSDSFTEKYGCKMLVFYRVFDRITDAIAEEKRIKGGSRKKKLALIEDMNPAWRDLSLDLSL